MSDKCSLPIGEKDVDESTAYTSSDYAQSFELPNILKDVKNASRFAIDIGGSLAKLAYSTTERRRKTSISESTAQQNCLYQIEEKDEDIEMLNFVKFETKYIETCFNFIQQNLMRHQPGNLNGKKIKVTGGGAYKYKDIIQSKLGCSIDKEDEMDCLVTGCNFLLKQIADESFTFEKHSENQYKFEIGTSTPVFPYILVNIGSGVSILKVEGDNSYSRVGGTSMGGGTFWGLGALLTEAKSFDDLLNKAAAGNHKNVDLLVSDIYGGSAATLGLSSDLLACSYGKVTRSIADTEPSFSAEDLAQSLLFFISNDIAQLASLHARLLNIKRIYFGGFFIRGHPLTMRAISYAVNFWSQGAIKAMYLRHEGYLGAIGAFLKGGLEEDMEKYSWGESYLGSSGLNSPLIQANTNMFEAFQISKHPCALITFPLLHNPSSYQPDVVDLTQDANARKYWLNCFQTTLPKFTDISIQSQPNSSSVDERAAKFANEYQTILSNLASNPVAYGMLTVRSLLDMREQCLHNAGFSDIYLNQKEKENESSLAAFQGRVKQLDQYNSVDDGVSDGINRWLRLIEGALAGNIFDWGAQAVAKLLEEGSLDFDVAISKLQKRPWLTDDLDKWLIHKSCHDYKCVAIFCDNSGADIILGILPLARQFLIDGSKVILCANSSAVVNDITYTELNILLHRLSPLDTVINCALVSGQLLIMETGQASPCLDLRFMDTRLCEKILDLNTDLIIIEGMGRALHTNFNTKFKCDSLKLAVIKNDWVAKKHGGEMYNVVCQYFQHS